MVRRFEPFALMLHRRYTGGESVAQLAAVFEIPEDRVMQRIRIATIYAEREAAKEDLSSLGTKLRRPETR